MQNNDPVLVTGANGYVASWLIKSLLEKGFTVHGTVRDLENSEKTQFLRRLAKDLTGRLKLFAADLLEPGGFDHAMKGCSLVFHTASPFKARRIRDPRRELIEPARNGTLNVLQSANRTPSVTRVVLTSSVASVYGDAMELLKVPEGRFTERHWNETSHENHLPYCYSKTVAERVAWKEAEPQNRWRLVVLNPGLVLGPSLNPNSQSESISILRDFGNGLYRWGAPELHWGVVDVRDVAEAPVRAGTLETASGRHILVSESLSLLEIGSMLRSHFGSRYPFPRFHVPKAVIHAISPGMGIPRAFVRNNVGYALEFDNARAKAELGMHFRSVKSTVIEHFQQLLDDRLLPKR